MHSASPFPPMSRGLHWPSPLSLHLKVELSSRKLRTLFCKWTSRLQVMSPIQVVQMCPEKPEFQWWILSCLKWGGDLHSLPYLLPFADIPLQHTNTPESDSNELLPPWFKNTASLRVSEELLCRYLCPTPRGSDSLGLNCVLRTHMFSKLFG